MTVEDKLFARGELGLVVGWCMWMFYVDNGMVGSREPDWFLGSLKMPIGLFQWYGLVTNVTKSKAMTCQGGAI